MLPVQQRPDDPQPGRIGQEFERLRSPGHLFAGRIRYLRIHADTVPPRHHPSGEATATVVVRLNVEAATGPMAVQGWEHLSDPAGSTLQPACSVRMRRTCRLVYQSSVAWSGT